MPSYGVDVQLTGTECADALAACEDLAAIADALTSHADNHPLIAAGAGTLLEEIRQRIPDLDTVVVEVSGGLFIGVATAAQHHGIRTVAVEPNDCRALNAALQADRPIDVTVDSIAADSAQTLEVLGLQSVPTPRTALETGAAKVSRGPRRRSLARTASARSFSFCGP